MRIAFCAVSYVPHNFKNKLNNKSEFAQKQRKMMFGNLGLSLGVGVAMSGIAAGIIRYKRIPNVFTNSLEIGSVCSYLTYMGALITTPFRVKAG